MQKALVQLLLITVFYSMSTGCNRNEKPASPPTVKAEKTQWTSEEIAVDTDGYLKWAAERREKQLQSLVALLADIRSKKKDVEIRYDALVRNLGDVENLNRRFATAYKRAEDEQRWPVKIAGSFFDQKKAGLIIKETKEYVDERQSMLMSYKQALGKFDTASIRLDRQIDELKRRIEMAKLAEEQYRLTNGIEQLAAMRNAENEISGAIAVLMSDGSLSVSSIETMTDSKDRVNLGIEAFLK